LRESARLALGKTGLQSVEIVHGPGIVPARGSPRQDGAPKLIAVRTSSDREADFAQRGRRLADHPNNDLILAAVPAEDAARLTCLHSTGMVC